MLNKKSLASAGNTWETPLTHSRSTIMYSHVQMTVLEIEFLASGELAGWLGVHAVLST